MTEREALKLALKALEDLGMKHYESTGEVLYKETFAAIKEALAQPEQEPVACIEYVPCCTDQTCPKCKAITPPTAQPEQHQDWCASLTKMLTSMPPKRAPCNCKPKPEQEPVYPWFMKWNKCADFWAHYMCMNEETQEERAYEAKRWIERMRQAAELNPAVKEPVPNQNPVAWITQGGKGWLRWHKSYDDNKDSIPLYTTPPQRNKD